MDQNEDIIKSDIDRIVCKAQLFVFFFMCILCNNSVQFLLVLASKP